MMPVTTLTVCDVIFVLGVLHIKTPDMFQVVSVILESNFSSICFLVAKMAAWAVQTTKNFMLDVMLDAS